MLYVVLLIIIVAVVTDQALKLIIINTLDVGQTLPLIDGVFHFTHIRNFGAAFSIMQNRQAILIVVTATAMLVIAVVLFKNINKFAGMTSVGLAMIIGGGTGNILDRIRVGYVVDFIDFKAINYPVFNFADCCVIIGSIVLIISVFLSGNRSCKKE